MASKQELLDFLDKRIFHPILNAADKHDTGKQHAMLADVKKRTEAEKARFHAYDTAERIVAMYKDDLSSEKARHVNAELEQLGLPRLADVKEDFLKLAGEAG